MLKFITELVFRFIRSLSFSFISKTFVYFVSSLFHLVFYSIKLIFCFKKSDPTSTEKKTNAVGIAREVKEKSKEIVKLYKNS